MKIKLTITGDDINEAIRLWIRDKQPTVRVPAEGDIEISLDALGNLEATYEVETE